MMQKFYISPTSITPEIIFSPEENIFKIRGTSAPEDVRALYYPAIEWIKTFTGEILEGKNDFGSSDNPLSFQIDLDYFNSSSAKFLYDIFMELKKLHLSGKKITIQWYHDEEDIDMKEAGEDISLLVEMDFFYVLKN